MSSRTELLDRQRTWAEHNTKLINDKGYLTTYGENLFQPLSNKAYSAFDKGSGSELRPTRRRLAKMSALHSSSALVANVFDYWTERNAEPILASLQLKPDVTSIEFEAQFSTGLEGIPPNLDLEIRYAGGLAIGVESKFTEWLTPKSSKKELFKPKYFPADARLWADRGLSACQTLAEELHSGTKHFRYLDAAQLLKHSLGLATQHQGNFELYYLYFDWVGKESAPHRTEIMQFADRVSQDLRFHHLSYQDLYQRLCRSLGAEHAPYMNYLRERYF